MKTKFETLKTKLNEGIATFSYIKANGETRNAHGTLNINLIVSLGGAVPKTDRKFEGVQSYFDTDKNEWRRFTISSLCTVD